MLITGDRCCPVSTHAQSQPQPKLSCGRGAAVCNNVWLLAATAATWSKWWGQRTNTTGLRLRSTLWSHIFTYIYIYTYICNFHVFNVFFLLFLHTPCSMWNFSPHLVCWMLLAYDTGGHGLSDGPVYQLLYPQLIGCWNGWHLPGHKHTVHNLVAKGDQLFGWIFKAFCSLQHPTTSVYILPWRRLFALSLSLCYKNIEVKPAEVCIMSKQCYILQNDTYLNVLISYVNM